MTRRRSNPLTLWMLVVSVLHGFQRPEIPARSLDDLLRHAGQRSYLQTVTLISGPWFNGVQEYQFAFVFGRIEVHIAAGR